MRGPAGDDRPTYGSVTLYVPSLFLGGETGLPHCSWFQLRGVAFNGPRAIWWVMVPISPFFGRVRRAR